MKFEGPTPETETRQVSVSFAAFIVVMAFALFGIAMAVSTVTDLRAPAAPQTETVPPPEESFESPPEQPPSAETQPDPAAVTDPDTAEDEPAAPPEAEQPAPAPAQTVAAATPAPPKAASEGTPPADTNDASFPTHHSAKPAAPTAAQPARSN